MNNEIYETLEYLREPSEIPLGKVFKNHEHYITDWLLNTHIGRRKDTK